MIVCFLILILAAVVNTWAFPLDNFWLISGTILLLAATFYFLKNQQLNYVQKAIGFSASTMIVSFFLLNTNFYPKLLKYQGGNELAKKILGNIDPANVYFWKDNYSSSFNFYTVTERKQFDDSIFANGKKPIWLLFDKHMLVDIEQAGYKIGHVDSVQDYEITRLKLKFLNPATRKDELTEMVIGEITGRN
jgi:hypothetical protein